MRDPLWRRYLRFWGPDRDADAADEIQFHIEERTAELVDAGWTAFEARAEAMRRFGNVETVRAECRDIDQRWERDMRITRYLGELRHDFAFGLRQLIKQPAFTIAAGLTLAIGIGATSAIFSLVDAVVLRSFPFEQPDRIVVLGESSQWSDAGNVSAGNFVDWRRESTSFQDMAALQGTSFNLTDGDTPERVRGARVSKGFFRIFGVQPALGRTLLDEEDQPGRERVVVLSHKLWARRFGGDPTIVGRTIGINGSAWDVAGVMPASFDYIATNEEFWTPIAFTPTREAMHDEHFLTVYGRIAPNASASSAQAELDAIAPRMRQKYPGDHQVNGAHVLPFAETTIGDARQRLLIWLAAVGCVLLIACGNVANLLIARSAVRAREMAMRAALGAGRARLVRQLLTESAALALLGAGAGLVLAYLAVPILVAAAPADLPRLDQARVDGSVLLFALVVACGSSIVFGLAPALRAARSDLIGVLKLSGRSGGSGGSDRARRALVAAETCLALTVLVGAGLLVRTAIHLQRVNLGFEPSGVLAARFTLPADRYATPETVKEALRQTLDRVQSRRGVETAALTSQAPLGPDAGNNGLIPEGRPLDMSSAIQSRLHIVTPGYFEALRIPIREGRGFSVDDRGNSAKVMVVSKRLAQTAFPGESAIGKRIACCEGGPESGPSWKTVVGVAGDVYSISPAREIEPEFYLPVAQAPDAAWSWIEGTMALVVRGRDDAAAAALTGEARQALQSVDPTLPLFGVGTMTERHARAIAQERFSTMMLSALGVMGLVLAAIGVYGVIAYFVTQRTHEIGVRMALGARAGDVVRLVVRRAFGPVGVGAAFGALGGSLAARMLASQLHGVTALDPSTFAAAVLLILSTGLLASAIPAARAARIDPTRALNE